MLALRFTKLISLQEKFMKVFKYYKKSLKNEFLFMNICNSREKANKLFMATTGLTLRGINIVEEPVFTTVDYENLITKYRTVANS